MSKFFSFEELNALVVGVLHRHGVEEDSARAVADVVVAAQRDGAISHGLLRLPAYVSTLKSGWINVRAVPKIVEAASSLICVDADNGFAQPALRSAVDLVVENARKNAIALLAIRNSHHFAALWPDVELFSEKGLIALSVVNSRPRILVWDASHKVLGTNPMAFACPRPGKLPVVWDQASSVVAQGEVLLAQREGHPLAPGVGRDAEGRPTTDPTAVLQGGSIMAFGGHKGSSIAFMVEILAAALTGGRFGFEHQGHKFPGAETTNGGQCVIVIDPERSAGAHVHGRIEQLLMTLTESGVSRLPADRRYKNRAISDARGIEASDSNLAMIEDLLRA